MKSSNQSKVSSPPSFHSYVGDVEINVEVKRYFCKAGVNGMQVRFSVWDARFDAHIINKRMDFIMRVYFICVCSLSFME